MPRTKFYRVIFLLTFMLAKPLLGQTHRVVTYVEDVQEERKSTRWTLTEWLRIKERMKLMDVWLAMFSDPKKDKFAPELSLSYGQGHGLSHFKYGNANDFESVDTSVYEAAHREELGRLQFWFTNLVSSTTGLRTLDIDLGLEASFVNRFMESPAILTSPSLPDLMSGTSKQQQAGLNLRIFGANEQDSTLVAKIGKFNRNSGFEGGPLANASGTYYGGEMALYFLNCFGLEGNYIQYKPVVVDDERASATSSDYNAFLEVFNLRLGYGIYQQLSHSESLGQRLDLKETGQQLSLRLFF